MTGGYDIATTYHNIKRGGTMDNTAAHKLTRRSLVHDDTLTTASMVSSSYNCCLPYLFQCAYPSVVDVRPEIVNQRKARLNI